MKNTKNLKSLNINSTHYKTRISKKFENRKPYTPPNPNLVFSFIPGTITEILVREGESVEKGTELLVLDAEVDILDRPDVPDSRESARVSAHLDAVECTARVSHERQSARDLLHGRHHRMGRLSASAGLLVLARRGVDTPASP